MSDPTRTLAKKLAEVMQAVERIPKNGRNDFHKYDYATEADIVTAIRGELSKRHVMLIPAVTGESRHPVGDKGSVLTALELEMEFLDGDSGESIVKKWRGYGTDKEDKGGYKAMTGGEKYFLLKTFLIPTGDDPEDDGAHPQARRNAAEPARRPPVPRQDVAPQQAKPSAPAAPASATEARINDAQLKRLETIAAQAGWKDTEVTKTLVTRFGISRRAYIPVSKYDEICKLLETGTEAGVH